MSINPAAVLYVQLDDPRPTLSRPLERLQVEEAEERYWATAVVNVCSFLEYGRLTAVSKQIGGKSLQSSRYRNFTLPLNCKTGLSYRQ